MQIHGPTAVVSGIEVNPYGTKGAQALYFGNDVNLILESAADCDEVIKAAAEAKNRFLAAAPGRTAPNPPMCAACGVAEAPAIGEQCGRCAQVNATAQAAPDLTTCGAASEAWTPCARLEAVIAAVSADILATDTPGQCTANAMHEGNGLFCWRPRGHDGWHYDSADKLAWRLAAAEAGRS